MQVRKGASMMTRERWRAQKFEPGAPQYTTSAPLEGGWQRALDLTDRREQLGSAAKDGVRCSMGFDRLPSLDLCNQKTRQ
jgi:hypothetical protein